MEEKIKRLITIVLMIVLIILAVVVVWPVALAAITGFILAYIFFPIHKRVLKIVKEKNIAALILVILIIFIIFIPTWFLFPIITREVSAAYSYSQQVDIFTVLKGVLPETLSKDTVVMINNFLSKVVSAFLNSLSGVLVDLPTLLLKFVVVIFVFFFSLRDSEKLRGYVKELSPFSDEVHKTISQNFVDITSSVIYGHIVIGIIQGICTGIGLLIFGVPQALLLTLFAVIAAIIPVIGAWLIWIPASIYLVASGHLVMGIGLFIYGILIVSWIDNVLRSYIISRKAGISSGVVFVGLIGGLLMFGIIGLLIGPLILAYFIVMLDAYKDKKFNKFFS